MSDDDQAGVRRNLLLPALKRGFPRLDAGDAEKITDQLLLGEITFGEHPVVIQRNFSPDDPILQAFLAPMGEWGQVLLEGLDPEGTPHKLRWSPQHFFLFVLAA